MMPGTLRGAVPPEGSRRRAPGPRAHAGEDLLGCAVAADGAGDVELDRQPGQPPQLKFTVDPEHNRSSGTSAMNWGRGMWQQMLG